MEMESATSIEKALDVLLHLSAAGPSGITVISRALGLPKSTVHRLLAALGRRGLVESDTRGLYRPGIGLVGLGLGVLEHEPVVAAARAVLEIEAAETGETLFLAGARGGRLVVLDKAEGTGFLRAAPRIGSEVPVHATAVGKLHRVFDPESIALPTNRLERFTPRTRVRRGDFERELERVRRRGWAENREEWIAGLAVVAAPIHRENGLAAALALAAPAVRLSPSRRSALAERVCRAARRIEARLRAPAPAERAA